MKAKQKVSSVDGGFGGALDNGDLFGIAVAGIGDLDGDGIPDLAVGARTDDDGGVDRGAVWVLFMNSDGTVKSEQKISGTEGNFGGALDDSDLFGTSIARIGDLDGDGIPDLAVGALFDDDGGSNRGAVWVLFMNSDGTVKSEQKISGTEGNFGGALDEFDLFGAAIAALDLNGDGVPDLAVAAPADDDGVQDAGAVWILFLNRTIDHFKCYEAQGDPVNITVSLEDQFGVEPEVLVGEPKLFCNPVDKNGEGILHPTAHLTCYKIEEDDGEELDVSVKNQFGEQSLKVEKPELLCVPSEKISVVPHDDD